MLECATKLELADEKNELKATKEKLAVLRTDFDNSLGVVDQLSNSQLHQSNRIGVLESTVAGKLDRSECDHLQSLVAKVLFYDAFKADTTASLQELHAFRASTELRCTGYDSQLTSVEEELQLLSQGLSRAATKKELHLLAKELQVHEGKLTTCASKVSVAEVQYKQ